MSTALRQRFVVEHADPVDWPEIDTMRRAYFASVRREPYTPQGAFWVVVRAVRWTDHDLRGLGRVLGCYSYTEIPQLNQVWIHDLFRAPDRLGTRALAAMIEVLLSYVADHKMMLLWARDEHNERWTRAIVNHRQRLGIETLGIIEGIRP